ncbi:hypothetical protein FVEN_g13216 [Fusarium venenatum]|nr:hypothetical protein FVEN_g13216 [Fusarium venenatum]
MQLQSNLAAATAISYQYCFFDLYSMAPPVSPNDNLSI